MCNTFGQRIRQRTVPVGFLCTLILVDGGVMSKVASVTRHPYTESYLYGNPKGNS
ncbi:hypothetical protein BDW62DRAFT_191252 [Aspergillus aurantiobrunneus]